MGIQRVVLVRGLPGSGKSTYAQSERFKGVHEFSPYRHYESDMYWIGSDGVYRFVLSDLRYAHEWCLDMTTTALEEGYSVVVSNTFTTLQEMQPYLDLAEDYGIVPDVIHCCGQFNSVHGIPKETFDLMAGRWEPFPGETVYQP